MTKTTGQNLTETLRRIKKVGPRTRQRRNGIDVKADMLEAIRNEFMYPGYYQGETQVALRAAFPVLFSWEKHVLGYRIDGELAYRLSCLTPWEFAAYLGRMVDAGIQCVGDGERFFQAERFRTGAAA